MLTKITGQITYTQTLILPPFLTKGYQSGTLQQALITSIQVPPKFIIGFRQRGGGKDGITVFHQLLFKGSLRCHRAEKHFHCLLTQTNSIIYLSQQAINRWQKLWLIAALTCYEFFQNILFRQKILLGTLNIGPQQQCLGNIFSPSGI